MAAALPRAPAASIAAVLLFPGPPVWVAFAVFAVGPDFHDPAAVIAAHRISLAHPIQIAIASGAFETGFHGIAVALPRVPAVSVAALWLSRELPVWAAMEPRAAAAGRREAAV